MQIYLLYPPHFALRSVMFMCPFLRRLIVLGVLLTVFLVLSSPSRARLRISAENVSAVQGEMDRYVEIYLKNEGASVEELQSFSLRIMLGGLGVEFTGVDYPVNNVYVFDGASGATAIGDPLSPDSFPNTGLKILDFWFDQVNFTDYAELGAGETYGLARIEFRVDGNATLAFGQLRFSRLI